MRAEIYEGTSESLWKMELKGKFGEKKKKVKSLCAWLCPQSSLGKPRPLLPCLQMPSLDLLISTHLVPRFQVIRRHLERVDLALYNAHCLLTLTKTASSFLSVGRQP